MEQVPELNEVDVARMWDDFQRSGESCCRFYSFIKQPVFKDKASRYFDDKLVDALVFPKIRNNRQVVEIFQKLNALVMLESFLANRYNYQLDDHGLYGIEYFKDLFQEATELLKRKRDSSPVRKPARAHLVPVEAMHLVIRHVNLSVDSLVALYSTSKQLRPCFHSFTVQARGDVSASFSIPNQNTWQLFCYTLLHSPKVKNRDGQAQLDRYTDLRFSYSPKPPVGTVFPWDPLAGLPGPKYFFYLQSSIEQQSQVAFDYLVSTLQRPWRSWQPEFAPDATIADLLFCNRDINSPQVAAAYLAANQWGYKPAMDLTDRLIAGYDWVSETFREGGPSLPIEVY
jgi:hypothetical protein